MEKPTSLSAGAWIVAIIAALALIYGPLLVWLARASFQITQLTNGALLVLIALVACVRDALTASRPRPAFNAVGIGLLWAAFALLWLARHWAGAILPLAVMSFCLAFAAAVAFLFGTPGIRLFLPALAGFLVFGILIGLFPTLDWPLRALAAKYAGGLLATLGVPVQIIVEPGRPAELALYVGTRLYRVATECNGFGLLTSCLMLATILAFRYRLTWLNKVGLLLLAVPVAIVANFVRIVSICLVAPRVPLSYHFVHEALGTVLYLGGLAVVWWLADRAATPTTCTEPCM